MIVNPVDKMRLRLTNRHLLHTVWRTLQSLIQLRVKMILMSITHQVMNSPTQEILLWVTQKDTMLENLPMMVMTTRNQRNLPDPLTKMERKIIKELSTVRKTLMG